MAVPIVEEDSPVGCVCIHGDAADHIRTTSGLVASKVWQRLEENKEEILTASELLGKVGENNLSYKLFEVYSSLTVVLASRQPRIYCEETA